MVKRKSNKSTSLFTMVKRKSNKSTKPIPFRELAIFEKICVILIFFVGPLTVSIFGIFAIVRAIKKKKRIKEEETFWNEIHRDNTIKTLNIHSYITSNPNDALKGFEDLESVSIPDSVLSIGKSAFEGCSSLTSVTIPDSVISIGEEAFVGCVGITSVTILNRDIIISNSAFKDLTSIEIEETFWNEIHRDNTVKTLNIHPYITSIPNDALKGFKDLESVSIPDSVLSIGKSAFEGCSSLTSVTIPDSVISIGEEAFVGCVGITSVTILNRDIIISNSAFKDSTSIEIAILGNKKIYDINCHSNEPVFKGGSSFLTTNIYSDKDPTSFIKNEYVETKILSMHDGRTENIDNTTAYIFNSFFGNETQKVVEVRVNSNDFNIKKAESEVNKYSILIGRLPGFLVSKLNFIEMHGGNALWGGSPDYNSILIHTEKGEEYIKENVVYDIIAHEFAHAVMDTEHLLSLDWKYAIYKDCIAISEYAKEFPNREDLAETFSVYISYRRGNLTPDLIEGINKIPERIRYLDNLNLNMDILP